MVRLGDLIVSSEDILRGFSSHYSSPRRASHRGERFYGRPFEVSLILSA